MTRALLILLALVSVAPGTLAQQLPPPRNPAGDEPQASPQAPDLILLQNAPQQPVQNRAQAPPQNPPPLPPQNAQQQQPIAPAVAPGVAAPAAQNNAGQPLSLSARRRQVERERKRAQLDRAEQFKAARAAEQQKLYQDWHERYIADAPVRVEYYRALAAQESQPAYYGSPYFYGAGPPVIFPPIFAPTIYNPLYRPYGTFFAWRW